MRELRILGKPVLISRHAILRARKRDITFPDQVYGAIATGKVQKFAKNHLKIVKRTKKGIIICVGMDTGNSIIIKTVERK